MSSPAAAAYEALVELIEHELDLAGQGRFDDLADLEATRTALFARLPRSPTASARPALERAALMQQRLTIEVLRGRDALLLALADVERGKRMARGYAPPRQPVSVSASA